MDDRHPLLSRQLRETGCETADAELSAEQLRELLDRVQGEYERADENREALQRSLDISARETRKMHEGLLEEHRRLRTCLETLSDAVFYVDSRGGLLFLNAVAEQLVDKPRVEAIGQDLCDVLAVFDEQGEPYPLRETIDDPEAAGGIFFVQRRDGTRVPVSPAITSVTRDEASHGFVLVLRDLTETRRAEERLHEARIAMEGARQAERAKSNFLANMSHEIRTPLNGVVGMADLLLETALSPEQRDYAATVRTSAQSLLGILNDILDFSKIEAGMLEIEPIPFDLRRAVEDVAELLAPAAERKNLELIVRYDPEAPRHLIGDPGRVRQIVTNLIGNAIKFTREGHVLVDVEKVQTSETQACLKLSIHDTGIGIAAPMLAQIFRKFTQADESTTRRFGGTGLGLAISKQLVELMGGSIGVDSVLDEGSTFWFELGFKVNREAPPPLHAEDLAGIRVLVIDSSETGRRILTEQLTHWRMRAEGFASGGEALRRLRAGRGEEDPFRIAILSNQLQGMDAETLGDLVKSDPDLRGTDLVLVAPVGEQGDGKRLDRIGFSGYLVKPIQEAALKETLEVVWGARKHGVDQRLVTRHTLNDSKVVQAPDFGGGRGDGAVRRGRILVAEDEVASQRVARALLEGLGFGVDVVSDGRATLDAHARHEYEAVLLDCATPAIDGPRAAALIREREAQSGRRTPIIAMTAGGAEEERRKCLAAGMDDVLPKPYGRDAFRTLLEKWIGAESRPVS